VYLIQKLCADFFSPFSLSDTIISGALHQTFDSSLLLRMDRSGIIVLYNHNVVTMLHQLGTLAQLLGFSWNAENLQNGM
jgi:hypothetical protein